MAANSLRIKLTLSQAEYEFCKERASTKNKSFWQQTQVDITKTFAGIKLPLPEVECSQGDKAKVIKDLDLYGDTAKAVACLSRKLGIDPASLVYRLVIAPHLKEIIADKPLEASAGAAI